MVGKECPLGFGELERGNVKKQTRREAFLAEMEAVVPFSLLVSLLEPFYPRVGPQGGRPPYPLQGMLRIHLMQNWSALSDEAMENERIDVACIRRFAGIDPATDHIPAATTILALGHFPEKHQLAEKSFAAAGEHLRAQGLLLREGTVVDATIIHAPTTTRDRKRERDPEMHSTRKGNRWFFGMKAHIGVDQDSGLIHSVAVTGANIHDVTMAAELLDGEERLVYGDAGYQGLQKREEMAGRDVECRIALRPGQRRRLPETPEGGLLDWLERAKAHEGQGGASLPCDQAAVRFPEDQATRPGQEPLQSDNPGSSHQFLPGQEEIGAYIHRCPTLNLTAIVVL